MKVLEGRPGAPGASAVPRLRRRRLGHDALGSGGARRVLQHAPEPDDRRRRGAVRRRGDDHRRRPWQHLLHQLTGRKWGNLDVENETGCGIVPYVYRDRAHGQRRAVGRRTGAAAAHQRSLAGLPDDRSSQRRVLLAVSGDHPSADGRGVPEGADQEALGRRADRASSSPTSIAQYTLSEIAIITSAGPARALGLSQKGHLGVGADADVTIYPASTRTSGMLFDYPRYVIKGGEVVVEEGRDPRRERRPGVHRPTRVRRTDRGVPAPAVPEGLHDVVRQLPRGDGAPRERRTSKP